MECNQKKNMHSNETYTSHSLFSLCELWVCLIYCCFTLPNRKFNSSSSTTTCALAQYRANAHLLLHLCLFVAHQGDRMFSVPIYVRFNTYRFLLLTSTLFTISFFLSLNVLCAYETRNMYRIITRNALVFHGNLNTFNTNYNFCVFSSQCLFIIISRVVNACRLSIDKIETLVNTKCVNFEPFELHIRANTHSLRCISSSVSIKNVLFGFNYILRLTVLCFYHYLLSFQFIHLMIRV